MTKMRHRLSRIIFTLCILAGSCLPARAAFVWTNQTGSGARLWTCVASSSDGTMLAAGTSWDYIYTSSNAGVTWIPRPSLETGQRDWKTIAVSADGAMIAAAGQGADLVYTSADSGASWTAQFGSGFRNWSSIASSADGVKLVAVVAGGDIFTSTNSGVDWTQHTIGAGNQSWYSVACSSDGAKIVAGDGSPGLIYTSTDSGATWTPQPASGVRFWNGVASSADGTKLVAVDGNNGDIYTSTNSGAAWTDQTAAGNKFWTGVASSADGTKLAACAANFDFVYTSTDSGASWTLQSDPGPQNRFSVASSADGSHLVAVVFGGFIWTAYDSALAVELASFDAVPSTSGIDLVWKTGSEVNNAGFHLWRADGTDGAYARITDALIPAKGNSFTGASYLEKDADVITGQSYSYKLEDVDLAGVSTFHGPVAVTAGSVNLVSPADGATVSAASLPTFQWKYSGAKRFVLEFSRDAGFSSGRVRYTLRGAKTTFTPNKAQWKRIGKLAKSSGAVYWRVSAVNGPKKVVASPTYSLTMQ